MSKQITFEQVSDTLHEIVAERPEHIYESVSTTEQCSYSTPEGEPSCIVGQVIYRLDPDGFKNLVEYEWDEDGFLSSPSAQDLDWVQDHLTHEQAEALRAAQVLQDAGHPWSDALEEFDLRVSRFVNKNSEVNF